MQIGHFRHASYGGISSFIIHYLKMQEGFLLFSNLVTMQARMKYMKGILFSTRKGNLFCQIGIEKSKGLDLRPEPLCIEFCRVPPPLSGSKYSDDCEFYGSNLIKVFSKAKVFNYMYIRLS